MCVNIEEPEFVKGNLDYREPDHAKSKPVHKTSKTVDSSKIKEIQRLYEWYILMFKNDNPNRQCLVVDGHNLIK